MAKKWKLRSISQRLFFLIITTSFVEPWLWLWNERKPQKLPAQFVWRPKQREMTFKFKCLNLAVRTEEHAELSKRSFQGTENCVLCTWFYSELLPVALWAVWMDICWKVICGFGSPAWSVLLPDPTWPYVTDGIGARRPVEKLHRKGTAFNNLICGFLTQHAIEGMYYQS